MRSGASNPSSGTSSIATVMAPSRTRYTTPCPRGGPPGSPLLGRRATTSWGVNLWGGSSSSPPPPPPRLGTSVRSVLPRRPASASAQRRFSSARPRRWAASGDIWATAPVEAAISASFSRAMSGSIRSTKSSRLTRPPSPPPPAAAPAPGARPFGARAPPLWGAVPLAANFAAASTPSWLPRICTSSASLTPGAPVGPATSSWAPSPHPSSRQMAIRRVSSMAPVLPCRRPFSSATSCRIARCRGVRHAGKTTREGAAAAPAAARGPSPRLLPGSAGLAAAGAPSEPPGVAPCASLACNSSGGAAAGLAPSEASPSALPSCLPPGGAAWRLAPPRFSAAAAFLAAAFFFAASDVMPPTPPAPRAQRSAEQERNGRKACRHWLAGGGDTWMLKVSRKDGGSQVSYPEPQTLVPGIPRPQSMA